MMTPPDAFSNQNPKAAPAAAPEASCNNAREKMLVTIRLASAPNAIRIPISFLRCDTVNDMSEKMPADESRRTLTVADVRQLFGSADQVGKFIVFNLAGNKCRLIAVIHYDSQRCYVRHILTHKEYDLGKWKKE
jgi:hypothetical protein